MLLSFTVGNFLSYKDPVTFSMVATKKNELEAANVTNFDDKLRILKCAVIYGANASGKSNLFKAMGFFRSFVRKSSKESQATDKIKVTNFLLSSETQNKPSYFEIIFLHENTKYRYGFEVDQERIQKEWLYFVPKGKETRLFSREQGKIELGTYFKEGKDFIDKTRNNALFLSVVAQFNGPISVKILNWFREFRIISGIDDLGYKKFTIAKLQEQDFKRDIIEFINIADLGIKDINAEKIKVDPGDMPKGMSPQIRNIMKGFKDLFNLQISTLHKRFDENNKELPPISLDFDNFESEGTKKFFSLAGPIIDSLKTGKIIVVDELDARLHPVLMKFIIKLFNSSKNDKKAQLIFASHDTNILSKNLFRRDQVWFTEKDEYGATDLYSLVEFKVRKDASFEKDYILGKYGAIPFINESGTLFNKSEW